MAAPSSCRAAGNLGCTASWRSAHCPAGWPSGTAVSRCFLQRSGHRVWSKKKNTSCPTLFCPSSHEWAGSTGVQGGSASLSPLSLLMTLLLVPLRHCGRGREILRKGIRNLVGLTVRKHGVRVCPCCLLAGQSPSPSEPCPPHLQTLAMTAAC